jgi:hypothetical protein
VKALLTAMARETPDAVRGTPCPEDRASAGLTLRDTRSRWGSCSAKGDLMFSFRLIMTPPEILDYVAAHETAHLVEMNHGPGLLVALSPAVSARPTPIAAGSRSTGRSFSPGGSIRTEA